jgi:hypothetical protein
MAALLLPACRPPRALVGPPPAEIRTIEGDASLRLTRDGRTSRSRFAFVLAPSRRGRVTVTAAFGAAAAEIVIAGPDGYFVLPSEKAYWKAAPEEIVEKFLGFPLSLDEMSGLICGRWPAGPGGETPAGWTLDRDGEGRTAAGRKGRLEFAVLEFFPGSPVPKVLDYRDPAGQGRLTVRSIEFNGPVGPGAFDLGFLRGFSAKSWEEIRRMLDHED